MDHKLIFLVLSLANVQFHSSLRYDQLEEYPVAQKTHSKINYKSHPPFGLLNRKRDDKKSGTLLKNTFNYPLGSDESLRKFQKTTNSLRRNNIAKSEDRVRRSQPDVCRGYRKTGNGHNLRRIDTQPVHKVDDDIDQKIQKLILMSILSKHGVDLDLHGLSDSISDADDMLENTFDERDLNDADSAEYEDEDVDED